MTAALPPFPQPTNRYVVRVMVLDAWDHVSVQVGPDTTVAELKREALTRARGVPPVRDDYEVKFRGALVQDEQITLGALGAGPNTALIVLPDHRRALR